MAWNEPGGSGGKDPWGNRKNPQGPPDLDEILKKIQAKLSGLFGGGRGGSGGGGNFQGGWKLIILVSIALGAIWGLSGFYIVEEGRLGVVLQFGKFHKITQSGLNWYPRFIQSKEVVNVSQVRSVNLGLVSDEAIMLTEDENIVDIKFTVQYKVKDPKDFLYNVNDPDGTLRQATESAVREIVGRNGMDFVITEGRLELAAQAEQLLQQILDNYKTGIHISEFNLQDAQAPEQVQHAFDDAVKAREDEDRLKKEAEAYSNDIIPRARGKSARMIQDATAYRAQVVANSEGESKRFLKVLKEYERAPKVTRQRLYLETMETVLGKSNKVIVDVKQGNSLIYLPLDRIISRQGSIDPLLESLPDTSNPSSESTRNKFDRGRDASRRRGVRQ